MDTYRIDFIIDDSFKDIKESSFNQILIKQFSYLFNILLLENPYTHEKTKAIFNANPGFSFHEFEIIYFKAMTHVFNRSLINITLVDYKLAQYEQTPYYSKMNIILSEIRSGLAI